MQIELSYKLQVMRRPISGGQFVRWGQLVRPLEEQDLTEIVTQGLTMERPSLFSIPVNNAIKKMFDDAGPEDEFDCQIVVKYDYPGLPSYEKSYPPTPIVFVPKLYWIPPAP